MFFVIAVAAISCSLSDRLSAYVLLSSEGEEKEAGKDLPWFVREAHAYDLKSGRSLEEITILPQVCCSKVDMPIGNNRWSSRIATFSCFAEDI